MRPLWNFVTAHRKLLWSVLALAIGVMSYLSFPLPVEPTAFAVRRLSLLVAVFLMISLLLLEVARIGAVRIFLVTMALCAAGVGARYLLDADLHAAFTAKNLLIMLGGVPAFVTAVYLLVPTFESNVRGR